MNISRLLRRRRERRIDRRRRKSGFGSTQCRDRDVLEAVVPTMCDDPIARPKPMGRKLPTAP
jgi:hypothetical protein